jgi:hypothetical protein
MEPPETFRKDPAGNHSRPDKAGQPPGSESCVAVGQPTLRSVDSEWTGRVIEPRNYGIAGADAVNLAEGNNEARQWPSAEVPPESKSRARS